MTPEVPFTQMRIDIKGQAFYFEVEAGNPYTAMRLILNCLELVGLPFPSAVKILKVSAGGDTHHVSLFKRDHNDLSESTNPADYQTFAGEAFWRLCGRITKFEAMKRFRGTQDGQALLLTRVLSAGNHLLRGALRPRPARPGAGSRVSNGMPYVW